MVPLCNSYIHISYIFSYFLYILINCKSFAFLPDLVCDDRCTVKPTTVFVGFFSDFLCIDEFLTGLKRKNVYGETT